MPRHTVAPTPFGPTPSDRQRRWHALETYAFVHFTVNTFTDREWGYGDESPDRFAPTAFDADQIVGAAAAGGLSALVLTCKHHDGFCLWPSRYTGHSVKSSCWRQGKGDVVRAMQEACARAGLRFGVYLSPWDRNHPAYGRPEYVTYYRQQLRELLTEYGPLFEVWFDGANGGDGYYGGAREQRRIDKRTYYGWEETWAMVRELQPDACMFSDVGPDIRWVGNERGIAGDPCWATLDTTGMMPGDADAAKLNAGQRQGGRWLPAECDVSIRPGWFYHATEDHQVRTPENLAELYLQSVGRGATLHLNLPPDRRGLVHENDVAALRGFRRRIEAMLGVDLAAGASVNSPHPRGESPAFAAANVVDGDPESYWAPADEACSPELTLDFPQPATANLLGLREYLPLGQRVDTFAVDVWDSGQWRELARGEGIGHRRLVRLPRVTAPRLRLRLSGPVCPALTEVSLHLDPEE